MLLAQVHKARYGNLTLHGTVVAVKTGNDEHFVGTLFQILGDDASSSQKHDDQDREWE